MSNRLTSKWTRTAEQAFGSTGSKGRKGEEFVMQQLDKAGVEYYDHENDFQKQRYGIDITYKAEDGSERTMDVKSNLNDRDEFAVYADWLGKSKADYVVHVNPKTGYVASYRTSHMREYFKGQGADKFIWINIHETPKFIRVRKVK